MRICVAVPLHNAQAWLEELILNPEYEYRFFDNASTDKTREVLRSKGFIFSYSDKLLTRYNSWIEVYVFAAKSDADWIKPLFVGDSLESGLSKLEVSNPNIGIILFNHKILTRNGLERTARKWEISGILARDISILGPFTGPPLAMMFSKYSIQVSEQKLRNRYSDWLADFQIFEILAQRWRYILVPENAGTFNSVGRTTYGKLRKNISGYIEEMQLMEKYRQQIYPIGTLDKLRITKRILDLGLHRFPNRKIIRIVLEYSLNVWR